MMSVGCSALLYAQRIWRRPRQRTPPQLPRSPPSSMRRRPPASAPPVPRSRTSPWAHLHTAARSLSPLVCRRRRLRREAVARGQKEYRTRGMTFRSSWHSSCIRTGACTDRHGKMIWAASACVPTGACPARKATIKLRVRALRRKLLDPSLEECEGAIAVLIYQ